MGEVEIRESNVMAIIVSLVGWRYLLLFQNQKAMCTYQVLQIRRNYRDNFSYFSIKTFCDPSLEQSGGGSNEGSQHMYSLSDK